MSAIFRTFLFLAGAFFLATLYSHFFLNDVLTFFLALLSFGGFAALIGISIEEIGLRYSLPLTSMLQSTLGSIPLAMIVFFLLSSGRIEIAQAVIVGAILINGLLVLGATFFSGSLASGKIVFDKRTSNESSILFIMAVMAIAFTGAAASSQNFSSDNLYLVSAIISVVLLITYFIWMYQHIKSDPVIREGKEDYIVRFPILVIMISAVGSGILAWWIADDIGPITNATSPLFVGAIILPLITSAAGNSSAVFLAHKGHPKLATALVQGSVAQIAAFLFPLLVLLSFFMSTQLTLATSPLFITALGISGLVIRQISNDGEATLFEGAALVGSFFILAILSYFVGL